MHPRPKWHDPLFVALALIVVCTAACARETTLAGVSVGQEAKRAVQLYGEPTEKDPAPDLGSTYWFFPPNSHGTKLMLEVMPGDIVFGISVAGDPNPAIKTAKGVQLGDPVAKVTETYGPATPEPVREGSPTRMLFYRDESGLVFYLRDEHVVQIDLIGDPDVVMPKVADWMVGDFRKRGKEEAEARSETGLWLKTQGYYPLAIAQYRRVLDLLPKSWEMMNNIGSAYLSMNELSQARDWFARGVEVNPDNAILQYNLGNALHGLGRPDEARPHLSKAVELAQESEHEVAARALMDLGNISDDEGHPDAAIDAYQRALKLATDKISLAQIWYNLGVVFESKHDFETAIKAFQTALSYDPEDEHAQESLARLRAGSDSSPKK